MKHIDEGDLQAYLDAELSLPERRRVELHLEDCGRCGAAAAGLREMGTSFSGLVRLIDEAPQRGRTAPQPAAHRPHPRGIWVGARRMLPRAAVFLVFLGAAASATVPGSPVRRWIGEFTPSRPAVEVPVVVVESPAAPPPAPREAGVFVDPVEGEVAVALRGANRLRVRAVVVEGRQAGVTGTGGAAASRFRTGAGTIEVSDASGGELRIEIPRAIPLATVIINDEVVLRKQNDRIDLSAGAPALEAAEITFSVEQ